MYICVDLKSFYASCECISRSLDPMKTPLVVADESRGRGAIVLAISPYLKRLGIKNRCRLFEIPKNLPCIIAKTRMKEYIKYSTEVYKCYLEFFSKDDIHVYSIDEVFIDISSYLNLYLKSPLEIGKMVIERIYQKTKLTATCGVGSNLFLAKIAMDIYAKKNQTNIAFLDEEIYRMELWDYPHLEDFWQIGKGLTAKLHQMGIKTMRDICQTPEEKLYRAFGVNAKNLIDHAYGKEECTMQDIKEYKPESRSLSFGQTFCEDYSFQEAILVIKELAEISSLELLRKNLVAKTIVLSIGFSHSYNMKPMTVRSTLEIYTNSYTVLKKAFVDLFSREVPKIKIRKISVGFSNLKEESVIVYDLFTDVNELEKEKHLNKSLLAIKDRYGKSAVFRAMDLQDKAITLKRNKLVGGHNGE